MASVLEDFIDQIHATIVSQSGDASKELKPYYDYGEKKFRTNEGLPPQIRWSKGPAAFDQKQQSHFPAGPYSLGTLVQQVQCKIWAADYDGAITELQTLGRAITSLKANTNNVTGLNQTDFQIPRMSMTWADTSANVQHGEMLTFNWHVNLNTPAIPVSRSLVLSASIEVSGAFASGSIDDGQLGKNFTVVSESYSDSFPP